MSHPAARARRGRRRFGFRSLVLALPALLFGGDAGASPAADAARAAAERLGERLERIRDPEVDPPRLDIDLRLEAGDDEQRMESWDRLTPDPADERFGRTLFDPRAAPRREMHLRSDGLATDAEGSWSRGSVTLAPGGRVGESDLSLTAGFDGIGRGGRIAGVAASIDQRRFGEREADLAGVAAYGSLQLLASSFLDLSAGTMAPTGGDGGAAFGTARFGVERRVSGWLVNPYGRAEITRERGRDPYGALVSGLRLERSIDLGGLRLRPQIRWEGERRRVPGTNAVERTRSVTPALLVDVAKDWTARIEHRSRTGTTGREERLEFRVSGTW
ncbi:hypothetical protein [Aureimonas jatrophae]|uniref:Autotransporter domain-containing protein n=1 Tax=Aureimonas jatrophae TaxID=1166073 RepID=A0A1H0F5X1_9HYPH|nr:hypothetical protein [Aureimonas jatrophae]MBB3950163.1 hypothetical protein [Aureimonas jatrophae]SDN90060.1 hypothetical protein SAMN05192530_102373 [Aureimonas jatrophae]